jgi:hypothetical protein
MMGCLARPPLGTKVPKRRTDGPSSPGQDDLQRPGFTGTGKDVVGVLELVEREVVGDEPTGVELLADHETSSVGVVCVSTSPVVMVTSQIQRSSRCNVTGSP